MDVLLSLLYNALQLLTKLHVQHQFLVVIVLPFAHGYLHVFHQSLVALIKHYLMPLFAHQLQSQVLLVLGIQPH